jgi:hypothetical protein
MMDHGNRRQQILHILEYDNITVKQLRVHKEVLLVMENVQNERVSSAE